MVKIVCLIGVRANPKGEEWSLGGYPLVMWPYTAACHSKYIGKENTYISTNSSVLWGKLRDKVGINNWISRPQALATDNAKDIDWIQHALFTLKLMKVQPDIVVHLRATTPLIDPTVIDQAIEGFMKHPEATALRSAHVLPETPAKMFCKDGDYWHPYITPVGFGTKEAIELTNRPRQMFPSCYAPNGYVDILRPSVVNSGSLHGDRILAFETPRIIEIDDHQALEENKLHIKDSVLWNNKFEKLVTRRPNEN